MSRELTNRTVMAAGAVLAALLLGGCVGGGAVLPPSETSLEELYREAYGTADPAPASGPMDVRMRAFCERFARTTRLRAALVGPSPVRVRECLETAAAEGLLSGILEQRDCEGLACTGAFVVEERWPPPLHPGWSGSAVSGLDAVFPRLANPDVLVYVYPHVATPLGVGVPGYVTALPLFERTEYALPGEAVSTVPPAEWPAWEADASAEPFVPSPRADPAGRAWAAEGTPEDAGNRAGADVGARRPDVGDVVAGRAGLSSLLTGNESRPGPDAVLSGDVTEMVGDALARGAAVADAVGGFIGGETADADAPDQAAADPAGEDGTAEDAGSAADGPQPGTR